MNEDIKKNLINTFGRISYLFVIFFFFIYILYLHNEVPEALKEAWSASLSFLSVLATLGAAYIASKLFNDWKDAHNKNINSQLCMKIYDFVDQANLELMGINGYLADYYTLTTSDKEKYKDELKVHARKLLYLKDTSLIKLTNIGYFIDKNEYDLKYAPQITIIVKNLETYLQFYKYYLEGAVLKDESNNFPELLDKLFIDTRNRYRAFIVELKDYYKA